ncbi:Ornithine carbamoyltransferase, catabolic [subsurface metagenome]
MGSEKGYGWLTGSAIKPIILRYVAEIAGQTDKPVIGIGGVVSAEDVVEMMMAGAAAVGLCTAPILKGVAYLTPKATQIDHDETAKDTIKVLSRYGEGIGIRKTFGRGFKYMRSVADHAEIPVINMQCETYHPTQALADLLTIKEKFNDDLRGKKFVISWTYAPNYIRPLSMPQSLILLMSRFGMDVTLAHPKEFNLRPDILKQAEANAGEAGVNFDVVDSMEESFRDAHVIYAKSWGPIMHTEDEKAGLKLIDKYPRWVVDQAKMKLASPEAIYMHCMPADRDIEVTSEVLDGPQSVIYDEAENRLHVHKALMALTMA